MPFPVESDVYCTEIGESSTPWAAAGSNDEEPEPEEYHDASIHPSPYTFCSHEGCTNTVLNIIGVCSDHRAAKKRRIQQRDNRDDCIDEAQTTGRVSVVQGANITQEKYCVHEGCSTVACGKGGSDLSHSTDGGDQKMINNTTKSMYGISTDDDLQKKLDAANLRINDLSNLLRMNVAELKRAKETIASMRAGAILATGKGTQDEHSPETTTTMRNNDPDEEPTIKERLRIDDGFEHKTSIEYKMTGGCRRKLCSVVACTNLSIGRVGVCTRHGAKYTTNKAKPRSHLQSRIESPPQRDDGYEHKPSTEYKISGSRRKKVCSVVACTALAVFGGVCSKHGAKYICSVEDCVKQVAAGKLCMKHGAQIPKCQAEGCTNHRVTGGKCVRHGAKRYQYYCKIPGCSSRPKKFGVCVKHGARPPCSVEGCKNISVTDGVCIKHGANVRRAVCDYEGCTNKVIARGMCRSHDPKYCQMGCNYLGCTKGVYARGKCWRHDQECQNKLHGGENEDCLSKECNEEAFNTCV